MAFYVPRWKVPSWVKYAAPFILLCLTIYGTWGFAHRLCYDQLYKKSHHHAVAIGLICTVCFLDALLIFIWLQIVVIGPGRQPKVPPFMLIPEDSAGDSDIEESKMMPSLLPPLCYQSGPNGNPIWCNECGSVKIDRAHHSSDLNCCVPRFDHKCIWLCAIIGKDNYRLFLQFVMYMTALTVIFLVSICVFLRKIRHDLDHNLVAILIISVFGCMMTAATFFTHVLCIINNTTSVEVMVRKSRQSHLRYCCFYNSEDGCRYVVQLEKDEYSKLWRKRRLWLNFSEVLGSNIAFWFIPVGYPGGSTSDLELSNNNNPTLRTVLGRYYESYSDESKEMMEKKIADNKYVTKFYAYGDRYL